MAVPPPPLPEESIRAAIDTLTQAEGLIADIDRSAILAKLDELRDFVEEITRLQVDMRLVRLRLQAALAPGDPDKTPVHGISSDKLRAASLASRK